MNDVFTFVSDGVTGAGQSQLAAAEMLFRSISSLLTFSQLCRRVCASPVPMAVYVSEQMKDSAAVRHGLTARPSGDALRENTAH